MCEWEAEERWEIADGCRCGCCFDPTGIYQVDNQDASEGPFLIGTEEEANLLAAWLNVLEKQGREV